jgi:hypothetical protein
VSSWCPSGVTTPRPVMTTRRSVEWLAINQTGQFQLV